MTTIWAHRVGNYVQQAASGWDYTIRFSSFGELTERLSDKKLASSVSKLAIVAHGDDRGTIQLDRVLTSKNVYEFRNDLNTLSSYLERYAKLIFYSCIAGAGAEGTALLIGISKLLKPDTFVIGFTIKGAVAQEGLPSAPGQVLEAEHGFAGMPARLMKGLPVLTEASVFAKSPSGKKVSGISRL